MKINIISMLIAACCFTPTIAKEPNTAETAAPSATLPNNWDSNTRAVYDLLLAQLHSAGADYAASADTLVKFANSQKDDTLYAKAFKALLQTSRYDEAADLAKTWKQHSKRHIDKFYTLALTLNGDTEQALNEIKDAVSKTKIANNDNEALERILFPYLQLLLSHWYQPRTTEVIARLHEQYPNNELLAIMYVKQLRWQGQIDKAIAIIDKRRFNDPRNLNLIQEKSDIYRYAVRLSDADKVWQSLLADYPNEPTFQFAYAQFLYDRYDFKAADKALANLNDQHLESPINTLKFMTKIQLDDYIAAENIFAEAFPHSDDKRRARYNLADSFLQKKQYNLAKKYFEPLVNFEKDSDSDNDLSLSAALKITQILYAQASDSQDLSAGDAWFERLAQHFRLNNESALQEQANALEKAGHKQTALSRLKTFLDTNPNNEAIRYTRGLIAADMHLNSLAIEDLKRLYAASPEDVNIQNALGYTLLSNDNDIDEGEKLIKKALFRKPSSPAIADSMGWVYYQRGEFETALPFFRFSYAAYLDGEIIGHYILALHYAGKPDVAKRLYELESRYPPNTEKIQRIVAPVIP